jgi:hypothetical protein
MLISVVYKNGECTLVDSNFLNQLIESKQVNKFLRLEGWIRVGIDQIRVMNDNYKGVEIRQKQTLSNLNNLHGFKLNMQSYETHLGQLRLSHDD